MTDERTLALIDDLRRLPAETPWVEFKENNTDEEMIGKLISAMSNAARMADEQVARAGLSGRAGCHAGGSVRPQEFC